MNMNLKLIDNDMNNEANFNNKVAKHYTSNNILSYANTDSFK